MPIGGEEWKVGFGDMHGTAKAPYHERGCQLVGYHAPKPTISEYHHQKPVFLQNRLYGKIMYGPSLWLCSNCHDSVHEWLYWLLGERKAKPVVGKAAKEEAVDTYNWYASEVARLHPTESDKYPIMSKRNI